jgi:DNA-binding NtrC family response regulator
VLIVGEGGSGKQTLAQTIHYLSPRRDGACAVLDCQHLPAAVISHLLFGIDRRDTGPTGREQIAAVYLREPAYLPREVQLLLCERITSGRDARAADSAKRPRILAGCATPLEQAVRSGQMLDELACALSALVIEVPPLRERLADLPVLVERLLPRACAGREVRVTSLGADAWEVLRGYSWPGNLRELYNVLRSGCSRASGEQLRATDLPADLCRAVQHEQMPPRPVDKSLPLQQLLEEAERRLIQLALQRARGHKAQKAQAARLLGIPRARLWRRMFTLGIADPEQEAGTPAEDDVREE